MKKHCVILAPAYPLRGGLASFNERLAREFQQQGYQVTIFTFSLQYPGLLFPGKTQYSDDPPPKDLQIEVVVNSINPLNWWKVGQRLRRLRPDLIVVRYWIPFMGPCLGTILRLARRNGHTKTIAIVDNLIPHERRPGDRLFTRYFTAAIHGFIVMSRQVEKQLRAFIPSAEVKYTPHPMYDNYGEKVSRQEALQALQLPEDQQYLLFFGFIRKYKGLDILLKAMADSRIQALGVKLLIGGEFYDDDASYRSIIEEHQLQDHIILHNHYISNEQVKNYFCAADLVVQPYRTATQSGISQLAFYYSKPMVATRVGGLTEIISDKVDGYLVDVDPTAIADAIVDYYQSNRLDELTMAVERKKKHFSWDTLVDCIESVSQKLDPASLSTTSSHDH